MGPDEKRERLQRFEELCRERGLALTVQRRRVLELILDRKDHPTADQIYDDVKKHLPGVSRTTVYRVLDTLVDIGVITKACSRGAATRFDPVTERHHHLLCAHCEKLIDIDDDQFAHRVELPDVGAFSFEIHDFCIQFSGICAACRKRLGRRGPAPPKAVKPPRGEVTSTRKTAHRRKRRTEQ
jgi:Fur family peroxide stress response transcriptional regulator